MANHGYWVYSDGSSFWGLGCFRNNEIPLECPVEVHNEADSAKKQLWHVNRTAELAKAAADAAAARKK